MSLRTKTVTVIVFIGVFFLTLINILSQILILPRFKKIEEDRAITNASRVSEALARQVDFLSSKSEDWASWDDAYAFMKDKNKNFINVNLTNNGLMILKINFMIFSDLSGKTVYEKGYDYVKEEEITRFPDLNELQHLQSGKEVMGLTIIDNNPIYFVSQPVLTSEGKGPSRGTIIFAKYIDDSEIKSLSSTTKLNLNFNKISLIDSQILKDLLSSKNNATTRVNKDSLSTYYLVKDYRGNPGFILSFDQKRDIYNQGSEATYYLLIASGIGILLALFIFIYASDVLIIGSYKRAVSDLKTEQEKFSTFMDNIPNLAWIKDPATWKHVYINKSFATFFNKSPELMTAKTDFDIWPKNVADNLRINDQRVFNENKPIQVYEDVPDEAGVTHHWLVFKFPIKANRGVLIGGIATDVTDIESKNIDLEENKKAMFNLLEDSRELEEKLALEKKSVEQKVVERTKELQDEKTKLVASVEAIVRGYMLFDTNGQVILTNSSLSKILGQPEKGQWNLAELQTKIGKNFDVTAKFNEVVSQKKMFQLKELFVDPKYIDIYINPFFSKDGEKFLGVLILIGDVTEEKVLNRSKDEFFSIASHELRTPLTAIRGNTDLINQYYSDQLKDPSLKEMVSDIHESSIRLIHIVNDFLNVSRLEQGKLEYKPTDFDIVELADNAIKEYQVTGSRKKLHLIVEKPEKPIPHVYADIDKVREVVINLIGNGLKFTEKGGITVNFKFEDGYVKTLVTDTGAGIDAENKTLLFHKFQQAGNSILTRDTAHGTGLGLYISRLMIEGMGGKINLDKSVPNQGSTFSFTLPIAKEV